MSVSNGMQGARLAYVVRKIRGTVERSTVSYDKKTKKLVRKKKELGEAFMVYMPNGHSYRLSATELVKRGFDRQPEILNLERVTGTNTPAGRFKFAINDEARQRAYRELEEQVIKSCNRLGQSTRSIEERGDEDTEVMEDAA